MSASRRGLVFRDLGRLFGRGALPSGDGALLDCFVADGDETAFEAIVARHGSMVLGVCRRLLRDPHDADDAFQATFLVLVKKARQLRDAERLGPWLYGVATRVATKARAREARRRGSLRAVPADIPCPRDPAGDWIDVRSILDAELGKLSPQHRDILVLCLLEGFTAEEASRQLSCPVGTVKSRLARGREALRSGLTARGLAPAAALAVVAGGSRSALASPVSEALFLTTVRMAGLAPEQIPHAVAALTRGIATNMLHKSNIMAAVVCGGVTLAGLGLVARQLSDANAAEPGLQEARQAPEQARDTSIDHMKQIMLAFHNYHDVNGHFPPRAIFGADGEPKLSWRVALLPFLDQGALFQQFRLDEAWDSPHNKTLVARMPDVFATPSSPTNDGTTRIRLFEGPGTMFDGARGMKIMDVTDGTSNTVAIVAGREPVPWTRPGELPFARGKPLPALDNSDEHGVLVGIADGSARLVLGVDDAFWKMLITPAGGEVLVWPAPPSTTGQPPQPASNLHMLTPRTATPPMQMNIKTVQPSPISPELDARLRAIEATLERLMQKLEAGDKGAAPRERR
jgi:RNA polymerase sigma factor (sigma-70 family)